LFEITILEIILGSDNAKVCTDESKERGRNAFKFIVMYVEGDCLARKKIMSRAGNIMRRSQKKGLDWTDIIGQMSPDALNYDDIDSRWIWMEFSVKKK